ncbi:MAG: hypothetical protein ACREKM_07240 [Longimicrobiales bacterium]
MMHVRWLLMMAFLAAGALPAQAQFSALPGVLRLSAADSAQAAFVQIRNEGDEPMQFRIYLGDYDQAVNGDYDFQEFGSNPRSCDGRISFFPDNTVLGPGEEQEIQVRMEKGETCWGLLFIESGAAGDGQVRVAQRIGVRVLNVPAGLSYEGEVAEVSATPADSVTVDVVFRNIGEAPVELRGRVEIRDLAGAAVASVGVGPLGVLPAHARRFQVVLPRAMRPGEYIAVPILDFGADYLAGGQALFTVP